MHASLILIAATVSAADLQMVLDEIRVEQEVPGVSAVVARGNEVIFSGASGVADLETGREMTADTVVYAGSLTKILTAVLTLQLIEQNELSLDDVVGDIAINSSHDDILVSHLLTHSFIDSCIHSFIHSLPRSIPQSLTHSLCHALIYD